MQIDEAGNGGLVGCENFLGPCWQGHARPRPDSLDGIFANQDPRVVDFSRRRQGTASMNENGWHCSTTSQRKCIPSQNKTGAPIGTPAMMKCKKIYLVAAAAMSILASLSVSPSTVPFTVT